MGFSTTWWYRMNLIGWTIGLTIGLVNKDRHVTLKHYHGLNRGPDSEADDIQMWHRDSTTTGLQMLFENQTKCPVFKSLGGVMKTSAWPRPRKSQLSTSLRFSTGQRRPDWDLSFLWSMFVCVCVYVCVCVCVTPH